MDTGMLGQGMLSERAELICSTEGDSRMRPEERYERNGDGRQVSVRDKGHSDHLTSLLDLFL
jgi:hypothetical protein